MGNVARVLSVGIVLFAALVLSAATGFASGVEIQEQGKALGNANAGAQAIGEDPSTAWWNPAGMARLERSGVAAAGYAILVDGTFQDGGSFRLPGLPFTGESGTTDEPVPVPSFYGVWKLNHRVALGLALNAPYGLVTEWGRTWIGRYYGTRSELTTININPSIAYRLNRCWSVGVGLSAQWAEAELAQAIDFGALAQQPQALDGHGTVTGHSWSIGYNLGVLWEPSCRTRVGLHYRSRVSHELKGDATYEIPPPIAPLIAASGRFRDGGATAKAVLPDQIALGAAYDLSTKWTLQATVAWTNWSLFKDLRVQFDNPADPDSVLPLAWEDAWKVALGVTFRPNRCWTFRLGTQWDQSPIPDSTRGPRIPLNDRIWVAAGVGYKIGRHLEIDLSYAHLFIKDGPIDQGSLEEGFLNGQVEGVVDILGLQLTWNF